MSTDVTFRKPSGPSLWVALAIVVTFAAIIDTYKMSVWPMADDEVPTLVEMGLTHVDPAAFSVPANQIGKLPRVLPVWYAVQKFAIGFLPHTQFGYRLPSVIAALLATALAFWFAAKWRGLWFATALALLMNGSQPFVYLSQVNRFYAMPLLVLGLILAAIATPGNDAVLLVVTTALSVAGILSHNVMLVILVLAFLAACPAYLFGRVPFHVVVRSAAAAGVAVLMYFFYIRPLLAGWNSTGNPTPVLVSFSAHAGIPALAFAVLGVAVAVLMPRREPSMLWWAFIFVGGLVFLQVTRNMSWNPRYFLFFMPAMWVVGAHAVEFIAERIQYGALGSAWYGIVFALLLPSLASHLQDGSRHDYQSAARVLLANVHDNQTILSDDAETISYYLPDSVREHLLVRTKVTTYPRSEFFLVCRMNAWMPLPQVPNRRMDLLAEIYKRRIDQFSHILRVYRVAPETASPQSTQSSQN